MELALRMNPKRVPCSGTASTHVSWSSLAGILKMPPSCNGAPLSGGIRCWVAPLYKQHFKRMSGSLFP